MAKKRKGARPAKRSKPARSVKKKATRKAVASKGQVVDDFAGLADPARVNLEPLKKSIRLHIERLASAKPTEKVEKALQTLRQVQSQLRGECSPTMVIETS